MIWRFLWVALLASLLAACATTPAPQPALMAPGDFLLSGRILIRQADKADVLRLSWQHVALADHVRLETSLGQTIAVVELTPQRAWTKLGDGRELERFDDTALAQELLGTPLPLRRFADWVRGEPPRGATGVERDAANRLIAMRDADWQLRYTGYGEINDAPSRPAQIEARSGDIVVRLRIEAWSGSSL